MTARGERRLIAEERQRRIIDYVFTHRTAGIEDLRTTLQLSLSTLRRDLRQIEQRGRIRRVHGGAVLVDEGPEFAVLERATEHAAAKRRIAAAAAELVLDGETIVITGGTTSEAMVPFLEPRKGLTVITNAVNIAYRLAAYPHITVIVLGGLLYHAGCYVLGYLTEQALRDLRADKVFHGIYGVDADHGLTSVSIQDVQTDRSIIAIARELVIIADHSKFGRVGPVVLAPAGAASTIVTDDAAPPLIVAALRAQGTRVIEG